METSQGISECQALILCTSFPARDNNSDNVLNGCLKYHNHWFYVLRVYCHQISKT